jgi:hypothetical protein
MMRECRQRKRGHEPPKVIARWWPWGHLPHADEQLCRDMSVSINKSSVIQASRDSYVSNLDVQQTVWISLLVTMV